MKIYIAICYDRHVDDDLSAFVKLADAKAKCRNFMFQHKYKHYGKWGEDEDFEYRDDWVYDVEFLEWEEAPQASVRVVELKGLDEQK